MAMKNPRFRNVATLVAAGALLVQSRTVAETTTAAKIAEPVLPPYECPEWFRDAKFGIWSHWGPDSVPGAEGRVVQTQAQIINQLDQMLANGGSNLSHPQCK